MARFTIGDKTEVFDWTDPLADTFREYAIRDLARELNRGTVMAFVGSGVSVGLRFARMGDAS